MSRALVVFESTSGNTQQVAEQIAHGISAHLTADVVEVSAAPRVIPDDVDLLVVGGPTHAFGMSRRRTRRSAARTGNTVGSPDAGIREWLATVQRGPAGVAAAAFDTRARRPRLPGAAGAAAERHLRRLGFRVVAPAESFWVRGIRGPLLEGEGERARLWGEGLTARMRLWRVRR